MTSNIKNSILSLYCFQFPIRHKGPANAIYLFMLYMAQLFGIRESCVTTSVSSSTMEGRTTTLKKNRNCTKQI